MFGKKKRGRPRKEDPRVEEVGRELDVPVAQEPIPFQEGFCTEPGCSNPLAPGQNYVCLQHCRRG